MKLFPDFWISIKTLVYTYIWFPIKNLILVHKTSAPVIYVVYIYSIHRALLNPYVSTVWNPAIRSFNEWFYSYAAPVYNFIIEISPYCHIKDSIIITFIIYSFVYWLYRLCFDYEREPSLLKFIWKVNTHGFPLLMFNVMMLIIDITHQENMYRYGISFPFLLMAALTILMICIYVANYGAKHFPRLWLNLCITLPMYWTIGVQLGYPKFATFMFFFIPFNFVIWTKKEVETATRFMKKQRVLLWNRQDANSKPLSAEECAEAFIIDENQPKLFNVEDQQDPYYKPRKIFNANFDEQARLRRENKERERKKFIGLEENSPEKKKAFEKWTEQQVFAMTAKAFEEFLDLSEDTRMDLYEDYLLQEEVRRRVMEQDRITYDLKREKAHAKLAGKVFDKQTILDEEINKKRTEFVKRPIYYDLTKTEI